MDDKKKPDAVDLDRGEGSKSADRRYREGIREFEEQHDIGVLGRSARREVEADPERYREAEAEGKRHMAEEDPELYRKGQKDEARDKKA